MNTFTVNLSDAELKALEFVAVSADEWINNAVHERCRLAIEEIFQIEVARMINDPLITEIPADKEAVVLNANIVPLADKQIK